MFADWGNAELDGQKLADRIGDEAWYRETLIPTVAQRGTAIIEARGASSAASAANAAIDHLRDWVHGAGDNWVSMGVVSDGSYGIPQGLVCGVPVHCKSGGYARIEGLILDPFQRTMLDRTIAELVDEREAVIDILK